MGKVIASPREPVDPAKVIGRASECLRRLLEAGLPFEALQLPIDDPGARVNIVQYWRYQNSLASIRGIPAAEIIKKFSSRIPIYESLETGKFWRYPVPSKTPVPYREETLEWCFTENTKGEDWRLVYYTGALAHRKNRNEWILPPRFWLVNFNPKFANLIWDNQEREIKKLGPKFIRCPGYVFRESVFDAHHFNEGELITGGDVFWYHWSEEEDEVNQATLGKRFVYWGGFDGENFLCGSADPLDGNKNLHVCLAMEADDFN